MARQRLRFALPAVLAIVVLAAWQLGIHAFDVPRFLVATPLDIAHGLVDGFVHGTLLRDTAVTLEEIVLGFAVGASIGIILGILVAWSPLLDQTLTPYIIALNGFPKVAIAPLIVVLLGQGLTSKIVITALVSFFPLVVNVTSGLNSIRTDQLDLMRSLTASRWQLFTKGATVYGVAAGLRRPADRDRARADRRDRGRVRGIPRGLGVRDPGGHRPGPAGR
jgi:NitT/TauT family transport system permease protein